MSDLISRQEAIDAFQIFRKYESNRTSEEWVDRIEAVLNCIPASIREQALLLLLNWAVECDFGYDNVGDAYEKYKDDIKKLNLSYIDGLIYLASMELKGKKNDLCLH